MTLAIAVAALVAAVGALILAVLVARQSAAVASTLARHRLGHKQREGREDPSPTEERRRLNLGAPRGTGERRDAAGRLLDPEEPPADSYPTTAAIRMPPQLPRPGQIGKP